MFGLFTKTMRRRLIFIFILISLIPVAIVSYYSIRISEAGIIKEEFKKLDAVKAIKQNQLEDFFKERVADVKILSKMKNMQLILKELMEKHQTAIHKKDIKGLHYDKDIVEEADDFLRIYRKEYGYTDILAFCSDGHFIYSSGNKKLINESVLGKKDSILGRCYKNTIKNKGITITDFGEDPFYDNKPVMYIATPMYNEKNKLEYVLAVQISAVVIDDIMNEQTGMGQTGETYLVGEDFTMRSNSRFRKEGEKSILRRRVNTLAAIEALREKNGRNIILDYRGEEVFSSYAPIHFDEIANVSVEMKNWAIIAEIDSNEALEPVFSLVNDILAITIITAIAIIIIGYFFASNISKPITRISLKAMKIADKDLTVSFDDEKKKRRDELGRLNDSFKKMVETLTDQNRKIVETASSLATSISEISATSTQLASSTTQTSTSITEITSTIEELKQISQTSFEKSEEVSKQAENVLSVAEEGINATNSSKDGIEKINKEMEYIAKTTVQLGERTQNISEIISSVGSLADQTNLLSVNASIEAAKAGEYGKGFAVVAKEVKNLAEQSKEATQQITGILTEIQNASSAAVLATERGSKAVKEGLNLSEVSKNAIDELSKSIQDSADSSMQISATSREQLTGIEQVVKAIENIKDSTQQNLSASQQLEAATKDIDDMAKELDAKASEVKLKKV